MVLDVIRGIVSEQFAMDINAVTPDIAFIDDLGADSLDVAELAVAVEEEYGLEETDEDTLASIRTVADLADYVSRSIS